ncbi:phospholipase D-like domain-containing protein [Burkholderiaceae bacterium FT117]|uniref:phospholipase D-like domain-containing protein n=1 Tax=Zeimonas sediminis TaxID=2944268 RepID=UPI00234319FC|nr:phospholipase D-like domain-containing protein [Zeimonas sediminis]MCM5570053.1 phospholipase D-like domain-containing protein [Zeimonas sediminis]
MTALYWQLAVVSTVLLAGIFLSRRAALLAAIGWTIWTFLKVRYPKLMVIQGGLAWGAYLGVVVYQNMHGAVAEADNRAKALAAQLAQVAASERLVASAVQHPPSGSWTVIDGKQHRAALFKAFSDARTVLCIASGWLGSAAADQQFLVELKNALRRGVDVYLAYGWQTSAGTHETSRVTDIALSELREIARSSDASRGELHVGCYANHEKLVIVDDYLIVGSFNWLSNRQVTNNERSVRIDDPAFASKEAQRLKRLVAQDRVL